MTAAPRPARPPAVLWLRRDLRLVDHPALLAATERGPVTVLFVLDDDVLGRAGANRTAFLFRSLRALDDDLRARGAGLTVRRGRPEQAVPDAVGAAGAASVHVSADFGPYGRCRDARVASALGDVPLLAAGSPYAVSPAAVTKPDGAPYQVFSPFHRAWLAHGWRAPAPGPPAGAEWNVLDGEAIPPDPAITATLPPAGEAAAAAAWAKFRDSGLDAYRERRNRPDLDGTSRLSAHLKMGAVHPRTLLADLGPDDDAFRRQLAWREFYASVLHHRPGTVRRSVQDRMEHMDYDEGRLADDRFTAWSAGRTGYPLVDAGMRQLLGEGWMHNRVRMVTASFLVKDLHIDWTRGARHFMAHLIDGDHANNSHGWQWTAGTGTDPAPYYRVFNPVSQSRSFDPEGVYIRRWIPELAGLEPAEIHEPWRRPGGHPSGYPAPIVDHAAERIDALARYQAVRDAS